MEWINLKVTEFTSKKVPFLIPIVQRHPDFIHIHRIWRLLVCNFISCLLLQHLFFGIIPYVCNRLIASAFQNTNSVFSLDFHRPINSKSPFDAPLNWLSGKQTFGFGRLVWKELCDFNWISIQNTNSVFSLDFNRPIQWPV